MQWTVLNWSGLNFELSNPPHSNPTLGALSDFNFKIATLSLGNPMKVLAFLCVVEVEKWLDIRICSKMVACFCSKEGYSGAGVLKEK